MSLPLVMLMFSVPLLVTGLFDRYIRVPFRVSSLPPGAPLPPLTYTIVEDVIAVDGGGKLTFRHAWAHRYQASIVMRRLLRNVALGWGLTGTIIAIVLIVAAWEAPRDTAYGLGFGIPWLWAIICTIWTFWYTGRMLKLEKENWGKEGDEAVYRHARLHIRWKDDPVNREIAMREKQGFREKGRPSSATEATAVNHTPQAEVDEGR